LTAQKGSEGSWWLSPPARKSFFRTWPPGQTGRLGLGLGVMGLMVGAGVGLPTVVWAGMPSSTLSDTASLRVEVISFFGMVFLACSAVVQWLWNSLRSDFPRLPLLSFPRAAGLTLVWGLLCLLVLTMISGARELLTPGAWRKEGLTYALPGAVEAQPSAAWEPDPSLSDAKRLRQLRSESLQALFAEMSRYFAEHDQTYPSADEFEQSWSSRFPLPERPGARYVYGVASGESNEKQILVFEPLVYDDSRLALLSSGKIAEISNRSRGPKKPSQIGEGPFLDPGNP